MTILFTKDATMSDMKCIKCNSDLEQIGDFYTCTNPHCTLCGDRDMWQELIKLVEENDSTRKALDVANEKLRHCVNITVEELDELKGNLLIAWNALLHFSKDPIANNALKKITTLEQKEG